MRITEGTCGRDLDRILDQCKYLFDVDFMSIVCGHVGECFQGTLYDLDLYQFVKAADLTLFRK